MSEWFGFVVALLATWRLCHLVAHEDGPFDVIVRLRRRAGQGQWGRLMDCPYCLSLWFAVPFAFWLGRGGTHVAVLWLGLSGGSCLVEHVAAVLRAHARPGVIELPMEGDAQDRARNDGKA